jgi:hypothetical protein
MLNINTQGYIYFSSGQECDEECNISINSLIKVDPKAKITVFSNSFEHPDVKIIKIHNQKRCPYIEKLFCMCLSPYTKTCFVDTDTYFVSNCSNGFDLLDYFDGCMVPAPGEDNLIINDKIIDGLHAYNSGIFFYKTNVKKELKTALKLYESKFKIKNGFVPCPYCGSCTGDQPYIYYAIVNSNLRIHALPNIWNFRVPFHMNLKGFVKIIHGNKKKLEPFSFETLASYINSTDKQRIWNASTQKIIL